MMRWLPVGIAAAAAVLAAVVLAIADLYITGHGGASLARPWISWGDLVQLSRADVILWSCALVAAGAGWFATRVASRAG
jgi:hypothetical protein